MRGGDSAAERIVPDERTLMRAGTLLTCAGYAVFNGRRNGREAA